MDIASLQIKLEDEINVLQKKHKSILIDFNVFYAEQILSGRGFNSQQGGEIYLQYLLCSQILEATRTNRLSLPNLGLTQIPPDVFVLENLKYLDLSRNRIKNINAGIKLLKNLEYLDLDGNPLPIPPEIMAKINEPSNILSYYFSIVREKKRLLNETKVLFVGQGSVGKTSILRRVTQNKFNAAEAKTDGITIKRWELNSKSSKVSDASKITLNVWDFGGQEIMHATHQFFLTVSPQVKMEFLATKIRHFPSPQPKKL
jgi:hypothetical protein